MQKDILLDITVGVIRNLLNKEAYSSSRSQTLRG